MEDVFESQSEKRRIRHVFIDYYLADRTIQIQERPVKNSGIPQETLLNATAFPVITATHLPDFLASRIFVWVTQSASIQRCFTSMDATTPRVSSWSAKPLREK